MSSLTTVLAEDRRLVILRVLSETGYVANEAVLRKSLGAVGHQVGGDIVRADLTFLSEHQLVRIETLPLPSGELWVAHLTTAGEEVAQGRVHPGVARRGPGE